MPKKIDDLRKAIDRLDAHVLELLNQRADLVKQIAALKRSGNEPFYAPGREKEIFDRLAMLNQGPLSTESLFRVFREIISASLALEHPMRVVYLGPKATFTHQAALDHFGASAQLVPEKSIQSVFEEVTTERAQYGVVPVENSNEGAVTHTLDMFVHSELEIIAESYIRISHDLLSRTGEAKRVKRIYSHVQALDQCRNWLEEHFPGAKLVETESTARAAQIVCEEDDAAAVASTAAAKIYGLLEVARHIEDHRLNMTRFLVIGNTTPEPTGNDKTSVLCGFRMASGMPQTLLEPLQARKISLYEISSHPFDANTHLIFLDLAGHMEDEHIKEAFEALRERCETLKHLGSYPKSR